MTFTLTLNKKGKEMASTSTMTATRRYEVSSERFKTMKDLGKMMVRILNDEEKLTLVRQCVGLDIDLKQYQQIKQKTATFGLHCCVCGDYFFIHGPIFGTEVRGYLRSLCNRKCLMKAIEADTPEKKQHMKCDCFHVCDQQQPPTPSNPDFAEEWINE